MFTRHIILLCSVSLHWFRRQPVSVLSIDVALTKKNPFSIFPLFAGLTKKYLHLKLTEFGKISIRTKICFPFGGEGAIYSKILNFSHFPLHIIEGHKNQQITVYYQSWPNMFRISWCEHNCEGTLELKGSSCKIWVTVIGKFISKREEIKNLSFYRHGGICKLTWRQVSPYEKVRWKFWRKRLQARPFSGFLSKTK